MEDLLKDLRFAVKMLKKSPLVSAVALLSLALALGANTTIFSLVNAVFLRGLPVSDAERLVTIHTFDASHQLDLLPVSRPNYQDLRDHAEVLSDLAQYFVVDANLRVGDSEPEQLTGRMVTSNYFTTLGVTAALGRLLVSTGKDDIPGSEPIVVVSYRLWSRRFGEDPGIIGQTVLLNNQPFTVVGVAPQGFTGVRVLDNPAFWLPVSMHQSILTGTLASYFDHRRALISHLFGRLAPGVSVAAARQAISQLGESLQEQFPKDNKDRTFTLFSLRESMVGGDQRDLFVRAGFLLMIVVGLVLVVACANVANLLLARSASRRREIALRLALGATRGRIVRQLLIESLVLSFLAGLGGLAIAFWARRALWALRPPFLSQSPLDLSFDPRVLSFTLILTALTGLLFGLAPALQSARRDLISGLAQTSDSATGMGRVLSFRNLLVIGQVALSMVALFGSGLFLRSLGEATRIDVGFRPEKLAVMSFNLGLAGYDRDRGEALFDRIIERVETTPGIDRASLTTVMPFTGRDHFQRTVLVEGRDAGDNNNGILVPVVTTEEGFFDVLGVELLKGRDLRSIDRLDSSPVAVINLTMAERFWPAEDALGKRFNFLGQDTLREVVGIVRTTKFQALGEPPQSMVYIPRRQNYAPAMSLVVRAVGDPEKALSTVNKEIRALEPNLAITDAQTAKAAIQQALWAPRMTAALLALLGALALLMASIGIYGVMSYTISQRRREIAIHMAMGADRRQVLRLVLTQGMKVVGTGLGLGVLACLVSGRSIAALLYGVPPSDFVTFAGTLVILTLVALGANLVPALRATAVNPVSALRFER